MTAPDMTVREEKIVALAPLSMDLREACRRCDPTGEIVLPAVCAALMAECLRCHIRVNGAELLAISTLPGGPGESAKIKRMRLGYCARDGCEALAYRLEFAAVPEFEWGTIEAQMEAAKGQRLELAAAAAAAERAARSRGKRYTWVRIAIGVGAIAVLWAMRQWYVGGTIPLLREPEKFRVTPASSTADETEIKE